VRARTLIRAAAPGLVAMGAWLSACSAPPASPPAEPIAIVGATDPAVASVASEAAAPGPVLAADDLEGSYRITLGANPDGGRYSGDVEIRRTGEAYRLAWRIEDQAFGGVAIRAGDLLGVGWGSPDSHGVVVYRVRGGALEGTWASAVSGEALGEEDLEGPPGLRGTYDIVRSKTPEGGSYQGTVDIRPQGDTYLLRWSLTGESYEGVGILEGDTLVVGWGRGDVGAVAYRIHGAELSGPWAAPGGGGLGRESLARR
jgi:hypothetical protein